MWENCERRAVFFEPLRKAANKKKAQQNNAGVSQLRTQPRASGLGRAALAAASRFCAGRLRAARSAYAPRKIYYEPKPPSLATCCCVRPSSSIVVVGVSARGAISCGCSSVP